MRALRFLTFLLVLSATGFTAHAEGLLQQWKERHEARTHEKAAMGDVITETFQGREILLHVPSNLPKEGERALVVVLHGGMGNAGHIHKLLGMDAVADRHGFVVAYLNGAPAMKVPVGAFKAWNAGGGCCGQPFATNVDDVRYIEDAVAHLSTVYGIDRARVYGMGHSNGAMMTQRLMCETDLYRAAVPVSGPLQADDTRCPAARGKAVLAIHGADDANVPIAGGRGSKGISDVAFHSQEQTRDVFESSGANYRLQVVPKADHSLATVDRMLKESSGMGVADTAAVFFGLTH